ncbi:uncharacterized protein LOC110637458 [Hevea brasiliensis]|uniref:uncharacterized protein LOC110637458 n=1 Tax=Hevea brasiliensis TaxID=3981 RepID=UPI0025F47FBE|nr:uncharacterized protein LOC110637458 [Hevea brasiliensis]
MGAYFEKLASKSFAVYSIAVTETENRTWNLSWHADEINKPVSGQDTSETANSFSNNEESFNQERHRQEEGSSEQANGWHSDNEFNSNGFPPRVIKHAEESIGEPCTEETQSRVAI